MLDQQGISFYLSGPAYMYILVISVHSEPSSLNRPYPLIIEMLLKKPVRGLLSSFLLTLLLATTPFMLWKASMITTGSPYPVIVVISESMVPAFHRGDLLFLWNRQRWIQAGEIPVCWFPGRRLPMVHRAIEVITFDSMRYDNYFIHVAIRIQQMLRRRN